MKNITPKLRKETKVIKIHTQELTDDYAWIKQANWQEVLKNPETLNPEVLNYLKDENKFTDSQLENQEALKETIFKELKGRIKDKDSSVPTRDGDFSYFEEYTEASEYPCYKRTNLDHKTEIIFDTQKRSVGKKFFNMASISHSHNHQYIAYNIDENGSENYLLSIDDLKEGKIITKDIPNTTGNIVWDTNNQFIYYIGLNDKQRPNKIFQHKVGENYKKDNLIFEEKDPAFFCSVSISQSKKYLLIRSADHQTSEYYIKDLSKINSSIKLFSERVEKEEYEIDHREGYFYILTNYNECKNFKIMIKTFK